MNITTETQTLVHLTLTIEEAQTLNEVLSVTGGQGSHALRAQAMNDALTNAGIPYSLIGNSPFEQGNRLLLFKGDVHPWDTPEERERDMEATWHTPR
jgi:hypothetical protein